MDKFKNWAGTQPPAGPPIWTALNCRPLGMPPPMSKITSLTVAPMGTSTRPVLLTLPASEKILVPLLSSVPTSPYQPAPFLTISGILAQVSTLLILVGLPSMPAWAGNGGRARGMPRWPSMEAIRAVSSPHTKAPAPSRNERSKLKPLPRIFSPSSPSSLACAMAMFKCSMAMGYSSRT